jgi:hypothetical protein
MEEFLYFLNAILSELNLSAKNRGIWNDLFSQIFNGLQSPDKAGIFFIY